MPIALHQTEALSPRSVLVEVDPSFRDNRPQSPLVVNPQSKPRDRADDEVENNPSSERVSPHLNIHLEAPVTSAISSSTLCLSQHDITDVTPLPAVEPIDGSADPTPLLQHFPHLRPDKREIVDEGQERLDKAAMSVTFLFLNGQRYRMILDQGCVEQQLVRQVDLSDVLTTTLGSLKDFLWRNWKSEWGEKAQYPNMMRFIHLGRLLEENMVLRDYRMAPTDPNVIHVSVPPADLVEDAASSHQPKSRRRGRWRRADLPEASCHCVIL